MAPESRTIDVDVAASVVGVKLREQPFCFQFFQAVRLLERLLPERTAVGKLAHPSREVAHLSANASLAFPASEIQGIDWQDEGTPSMTVNFMGLTGPEGVLPIPYTALIRERLRASDSSLRDFFDIFNHRIISLFYQAWRKYRFDVAYEQGERNRFGRQLLSLVGLGTDGLQDRQAVPDDALIYYAGLLAQRPRSAQALSQIIRDYFDVPVEVEQFSGSWYRLDPDTQCCFSEDSTESEQLGLGAVVGDEVWNRQSRVRIVLGPLTMEQYLSFLPDGACHEALRAWTRFFSNDEFDFEVKLILEREDVPGCELGAGGACAPRLGWVTWVKSAPVDRDPGDTVLWLEPVKGRRYESQSTNRQTQ
jgi:type VI secretion system protein ImpH